MECGDCLRVSSEQAGAGEETQSSEQAEETASESSEVRADDSEWESVRAGRRASGEGRAHAGEQSSLTTKGYLFLFFYGWLYFYFLRIVIFLFFL
jgi:hypothetical protein